MTENSIHVKLPALPDPSVFKDPERSILTSDRSTLLCYDPDTHSAFIYNIEAKRWTISVPLDFETFMFQAALAGYAVTDGPDAKRWVARCSTQPKGVTAH